MAKSCHICYALLSDHDRRGKHSAIQCPLAMKRYALNPNGDTGSLYDGWIDDTLPNSDLAENFIHKEKGNRIPKCDVINGNTPGDDFLRIFDIDDELWLSIMLEMSPDWKTMTMLRNYHPSTDRNTRFLHYHCIHHQCHLLNEPNILRDVLPRILKNPGATHITTDITYGIDFIIKFEFPTSEKSDEIDDILKKVCSYFTTESSGFLTSQEQEKLNQVTPTILSRNKKICSFQSTSNFIEMCQNIRRHLLKQEESIPLWYTLHPIKTSSSDCSLAGKRFVPLDPSVIKEIQQIILELLDKLKLIEDLFDKTQSSSLPKDLQNQYNETFEQLNQAKNMYKEFQDRLTKVVLNFRRGAADASSSHRELHNLLHKKLDSALTMLHETIVDWQNKHSFITKLKKDYDLDYYNVADLEVKGNDQQTLEENILSVHASQKIHILCSSSKLADEDVSQHQKLCQQLMDEKKSDPSLHIVFADFSKCKFTLPEMKVLSRKSEPSETTTPTIETRELNILLLGETGVGKSTFINAFANYLVFQSMEQAEENEPIVLIPVSFVMISDQFEECEIKLGEQNNSNEDFDHSGQTITQHCQSYLFNLKNNTKLRIIDTPGIGDTRGIAQDDKNIQYILSYVGHLSHLNVVCILMKPSTARLHVLFRSCLEQIFNFLGPNARDNIVFCFTSGRSTFFLPGNTAPLLKKMLNDLPANHTPSLAKANMFFFDSESFRYLAARKSQANIRFSDEQNADFQTSWKKSMDESVRFMHLIQSRPRYQMNTWHSIKHAQILVTSLVRPILETLRHILRNQTLQETDDKQYSLGFHVESLSQSSYLCTACPYKSAENKILPMVNHPIHQYRTADKCEQCHCSYNKHLPVLYQIKYDLRSMKETALSSKTNEMHDCLLRGSIQLAHFLLQTTRLDEDPFLSWLDLFIHEESYLCLQDSSNNANKQLHIKLIQLKNDYEKQLHGMKSNQQQINIDEIYQWMEKIQTFQMIEDQMNVSKESEMKIMQYHEHDVLSRYPEIHWDTPLMRLMIEDSSFFLTHFS